MSDVTRPIEYDSTPGTRAPGRYRETMIPGRLFALQTTLLGLMLAFEAGRQYAALLIPAAMIVSGGAWWAIFGAPRHVVTGKPPAWWSTGLLVIGLFGFLVGLVLAAALWRWRTV